MHKIIYAFILCLNVHSSMCMHKMGSGALSSVSSEFASRSSITPLLNKRHISMSKEDERLLLKLVSKEEFAQQLEGFDQVSDLERLREKCELEIDRGKNSAGSLMVRVPAGLFALGSGIVAVPTTLFLTDFIYEPPLFIFGGTIAGWFSIMTWKFGKAALKYQDRDSFDQVRNNIYRLNLTIQRLQSAPEKQRAMTEEDEQSLLKALDKKTFVHKLNFFSRPSDLEQLLEKCESKKELRPRLLGSQSGCATAAGMALTISLAGEVMVDGGLDFFVKACIFAIVFPLCHTVAGYREFDIAQAKGNIKYLRSALVKSHKATKNSNHHD